MSFQADSLRDSIEAAWALTGRLTKIATATNKEVVEFFAHPQIAGAGEFSKAVEVRKINTDESENITRHPRFEEVNDNYEIIVRYRLLGGDEVLYDQAEQDIEDMCEEVIRTVRTIYDPFTDTGVFWNKTSRWSFDDQIDGRQVKMELRRIYNLQLTRINSKSLEVFQGYGGVLQLDTSATTADSKPVGDYIYTEAWNVTFQEGYRHSSELTNATSNGIGVPLWFRGIFLGRFSCEMYAKKSDVDSVTIEAIDNIYKAQTNGETATIVFLHATSNREGTPATLTTSTEFRVNSIEKLTEDENLVKFRVVGDITQPSVFTVT